MVVRDSVTTCLNYWMNTQLSVTLILQKRLRKSLKMQLSGRVIILRSFALTRVTVKSAEAGWRSIDMDRRSPEMLTYILDMYSYDPETGEFRNKHGRIVGCYTKRYPEISIRGKTFRLHQLAYILIYGQYPQVGMEIDHKNGNKHDNRLANLRLVTKSENQFNRPRSERHGIYFETSSGKWVAQLRRGGKTYKGRFLTEEQAKTFRSMLESTHYTGITE